MRYLSSISLALIVHVLLSIVVLMALACTATPAWKAGLWLPGFQVSTIRSRVGRGKRVGCRAAGKATGKAMRKLFKHDVVGSNPIARSI